MSVSDAGLALDLSGITAVFAPDGEFLALYEPRDDPGSLDRSPSSPDSPRSQHRTPATSGPFRLDHGRYGRLWPCRSWRSLGEIPADLGRTVVTIGNFDGVHLGHRTVLSRALLVEADAGADQLVAVTFDPHPMAVLRPEHAPSS